MSIGVAYVGGVEKERDKNGKWIAKDTRTEEQKDALLDLLLQLKDTYQVAKFTVIEILVAKHAQF